MRKHRLSLISLGFVLLAILIGFTGLLEKPETFAKERNKVKGNIIRVKFTNSETEKAVPKKLVDELGKYFSGFEEYKGFSVYVTFHSYDEKNMILSIAIGDDVEEEVKRSMTLFAEATNEGWNIYNLDLKDYVLDDKLKAEIPLSDEKKRNLWPAMDRELQRMNNVSSELSFPWSKGVSWQWGQSWHDVADDRYGDNAKTAALDFRVTGIDDKNIDVLASEEGTITWVCVGKEGRSVSIRVKSTSTPTRGLGYFHLDRDTYDVDKHKQLVLVKKGEFLGELEPGTFSEYPCGRADQHDTNAHIHFEMPRDESVTFDSWTFSYPSNCAKNSREEKCVYDYFTSNNSESSGSGGGSSSCAVPSSGDWVITGQCEVDKNITVPGNIVVNDNSVLRVINGAKVNLDLARYKVLVKPSGKIVIDKISKIY